MRYMIAYSKQFIRESIERSADELISMIAIEAALDHMSPIGPEDAYKIEVPALVMKVKGRGEHNKKLIAASIEYADIGEETEHFVSVHFRDPRFGTFRFAKSSPVVFKVPEDILERFNEAAVKILRAAKGRTHG